MTVFSFHKLNKLLGGMHDDATPTKIRALSKILSIRPNSYESRVAQIFLLEGVAASIDTGQNCCGSEDWALIDAFMKSTKVYEDANDALAEAYAVWSRTYRNNK